LDAIEKTCFKLEELPERGHIPIELRPTGIKRYLEIFYKPYRIIYEIENDIVYIIH
jgi:toxin ParE1/3/4